MHKFFLWFSSVLHTFHMYCPNSALNSWWQYLTKNHNAPHSFWDKKWEGWCPDQVGGWNLPWNACVAYVMRQIIQNSSMWPSDPVTFPLIWITLFRSKSIGFYYADYTKSRLDFFRLFVIDLLCGLHCMENVWLVFKVWKKSGHSNCYIFTQLLHNFDRAYSLLPKHWLDVFFHLDQCAKQHKDVINRFNFCFVRTFLKMPNPSNLFFCFLKPSRSWSQIFEMTLTANKLQVSWSTNYQLWEGVIKKWNRK